MPFEIFIVSKNLPDEHFRKLAVPGSDVLLTDIRLHDLRRHLATYVSRNGIPLEVISRIILRHSDLKTTQMYLGKITDTEAIRWVDVLYNR